MPSTSERISRILDDLLLLKDHPQEELTSLDISGLTLSKETIKVILEKSNVKDS